MAEPQREPVYVEGYRHGRVPREVREQQMLDIAEAVFTEHGFAGASIEEICRRAGLKRPLFYTYFGGKDGLYMACYRRARAELDERLATGAIGTPEHGKHELQRITEAIARAYFEFLQNSPTRWDMLYGPGAATAAGIAEEITGLRAHTVGVLAAVIRGHARADVDDQTILAFAHAASGSGEQLARWWRQNPELTIDELVDLTARYNWAGLSQLL